MMKTRFVAVTAAVMLTVGGPAVGQVIDDPAAWAKELLGVRDAREDTLGSRDAARARLEAVNRLLGEDATTAAATSVDATFSARLNSHELTLASLLANAPVPDGPPTSIAQASLDDVADDIVDDPAEAEAAQEAVFELAADDPAAVAELFGVSPGAQLLGGLPVSVDGRYCPVPGGRFIDDWHFPRGGGTRLHKGVDIFAEIGTGIYSIDDARIVSIDATDQYRGPGSRDLGGRSVGYTMNDGTYVYNAHMDSIAPGLEVGQEIAGGTLIGTVGNSGNARTTPPHNHLGTKAGGRSGAWTKPHPLVFALCRP